MTQPPLLSRYRDMLRYDSVQSELHILNLWQFPSDVVFLRCCTARDVVAAVAQMITRERSALVFAAGYGLVLAAQQHAHMPTDTLRAMLIQTAEAMRQSRPHADAMHRLVDATLAVGDAALQQGTDPAHAMDAFITRRIAYLDTVSEACGRAAAGLLPQRSTILTHGYGSAALNWMLYAATVEQGRAVHLYVTETRPLLQGSRLTAREAHELGVPLTLITDNMPGHFLSRGTFTHVVVAADRIARDGTIAATTGTYQYAALARYHQVPVIVLGYDGPDAQFATERDLHIEPRNEEEVRHLAGIQVAPTGVPTYYTPFDITPPDLITQIVTDRGCFVPGDMANYHGDHTGAARAT